MLQYCDLGVAPVKTQKSHSPTTFQILLVSSLIFHIRNEWRFFRYGEIYYAVLFNVTNNDNIEI